MVQKVFSLIFLAAISSLTPVARGADGEDPVLLFVRLHDRAVVAEKVATNLAPALLAIKDSGATLKGFDDKGNPILAVPKDNVEKCRKSAAVRSLTDEVPRQYQPIARLKISYNRDSKLTKADLERMGLKMIEDYEKGAWIIAETTGKPICAILAEQLEKNAKVRYATVIFKVKATQTDTNASGKVP